MITNVAMTRALPVFLVVLLLAHGAGAAGPAGRLAALRTVMTERLALMTDVARFKWNEKLPIEDRDREAVVLDATVAEAVAAGLDPSRARSLVEAQITAAKLVQTDLFDTWTAAGAGRFADVPSLAATLRPEIGRLTADLIEAAKAAENDLGTCEGRRILAPLPDSVADFPEAWSVAVDGALAGDDDCP